jgi:hypothetical protein
MLMWTGRPIASWSLKAEEREPWKVEKSAQPAATPDTSWELTSNLTLLIFQGQLRFPQSHGLFFQLASSTWQRVKALAPGQKPSTLKSKTRTLTQIGTS